MQICPLSDLKIHFIGAERMEKEFNIFLEAVGEYLNKSFKEIRENIKRIEKMESGPDEKAEN